MLRIGKRGRAVGRWQEFLVGQGRLVGSVDRVFGPQTDAATRSFQGAGGLVADGVVGPATLAYAEDLGYSDGYQFDPLVVSLADGLGVTAEILQSFVIVESGARPAVRFEPHLAHRKLGARAACIPWTPKNERQPWSVIRQETSRAALDRALAHHPGDDGWAAAIIESSSFGLFQVLGSHLLALFPGDPMGALAAYDDDERLISFALVSGWFLSSPRALKAAREGDLERLIRYYNGPKNVPAYLAKFKTALAEIRA
jgi:hypothetical protein